MKLLFTIVITSSVISTFAQQIPVQQNITKAFLSHGHDKPVNKDTVVEKDTSKENKEPRYFYLSGNTNVFVNTKGGAAKRFSPSVEYGKTYGIFDIGLATGRLNSFSSGGDTSRFLEFRPTINIFSKGRFAEGLCLGGGYVFKAKQGLMTEICNSINFNISETWALAVLQGYYFFDGTNSSRNTQYMGFNVTYNFLKKHSVNIKRKKAVIVSDN
jgi:hypothetical protein